MPPKTRRPAWLMPILLLSVWACPAAPRAIEPSPTPSLTETPTLSPSPTGVPGALYVSPTADPNKTDGTREHPFQTVSRAVAAAPDGGQVILLPGIYTGDGNVNSRIENRVLALRSKQGPAVTILDGGNIRYDNIAAIVCVGAKPGTIIEGLTIQNYQRSQHYTPVAGAAFQIDDSDISIVNCNLFHNGQRASYPHGVVGGAIGGIGSSLCMEGCRVEGSYAGDDCTGPRGTCAGAQNPIMALYAAHRLTISKCVFQVNYANAFLLPLVEISAEAVDIKDSTFANNSGYVFKSTANECVVTNCTFHRNQGAFANDRFGSIVSFTSCTFSGHDITLTSVGDDTRMDLSNCIFSSTSMMNFDGDGPLVSHGHNLSDIPFAELSGQGDMIVDDPMLGPLADNGGPTMTQALLNGSPAIDAGDSSLAPATDQRGLPRRSDGDGDGIARVDIGAYEVQGALSVPTARALLDYILGLSADPAGLDLNADGAIDMADVAAALVLP